MQLNEAALTCAATQIFRDAPPRHLGLAVSGGSDSLAMLQILAPWARGAGMDVSVATVDHRLRDEARAEAEFVAGICHDLSIAHDILSWQEGPTGGNLQNAARQARRGLLTSWAKDAGVDAICLGHTLDDQAETVLMRLARGSGADGLSGMAEQRSEGGLKWLRPLLSLRRADLQSYLQARGIAWVDDPSNEDDRFDRIKARNALAQLAPLGIDAERIAQTAERLGWAKDALNWAAAEVAQRTIRMQHGDLLIDKHSFAQVPYEIQLRLLSAAIRWVSGAVYRPRLEALQEAYSACLANTRRTLSGVLLMGDATIIRISREPNAVRQQVTPVDLLWDQRWRLLGPAKPGMQIAALGEAGIKDCPDWRASGLPRDSVLASPAIWQAKTLVSAPMAGNSQNWSAIIATGFHEWLLSH